MAKLDIRRLVKSSLERVKQAEHVRDTDPSIQHLEENVVRTIAELEVKRAERVRSNPEPSHSSTATPNTGDTPKTPQKPNARRAA